MPIKSYRDLIVWQKSLKLLFDIYRLTVAFPRDERFGAVSQLRRAAMSILANIAEGHGRATRGEYLNQLSVAQGSINEVETLLIVSRELGFAAAEQIAPIEERVSEVSRMLGALRRALSPRKRPSPAPSP